MPPELLVSVRDVAEAEAAFAAGARWLDLKNPSRGALGAVSPETLAAVCAKFPESHFTCAGGELELDEAGPLLETLERVQPKAIRYFKVGLAGCAARKDWPERWRSLVARLPAGTLPAAVHYADAAACGAPHWREVLAAGTEVGCRVLLLDTFVKDGRSLFDHLPPEALAEPVAAAQARGWRVALAGSLRPEHFAAAFAFRPGWVAVRGAVCERGRDRLDSSRCRGVVEAWNAAAAGRTPPESRILRRLQENLP